MIDIISNYRTVSRQVFTILSVLAALLLVMSCGWLTPRSRVSTNENTNTTGPGTVDKPSTSLDSEKYSELRNKKEDLAKLTLPLKLDPKAVIKGKVLVVGQGLEKFGDDDKLNRGFADYRLARSLDELETVVQVVCTKGRHVADYEGKYDQKAKGFESNCKVSLIDYKALAIVAQKSFSNSKPPEVITTIEPDLNHEYLMPRPLGDIARYLESFEVDKEIKPNNNLLSEKELLRLPLKVAIDPAPTIKGKVMIAQKTVYGVPDRSNSAEANYSGIGVDYGFGFDKLSSSSSDLTTFVKIECAKGSMIGKVEKTSEFSNKCEVSLVDYKTLTVFAQKTIENKAVTQDASKENFPIDWVVKMPEQEIKDYLHSFPVQ